MQAFGKSLIIAGIAIAVIGILVAFGPKIPYLGKLPGDIHVKRDNFVFYFPLATSIIVSAVLTLILYLISKR